MRIDHHGMSLWFETADAPAPEQIVADGASISLTIAVQPPDASNQVEVLYRINGGPVQVLPAKWLRNDFVRKTQYFRAQFPVLRAGDKVDYSPICRCAGRQIPSASEAERLASSFRIAGSEKPILREERLLSRSAAVQVMPSEAPNEEHEPTPMEVTASRTFDNITVTGNVGIGTTSLSNKLHISGTAPADANDAQLRLSATDGNFMLLGRAATYGFVPVRFSSQGDGAVLLNLSSERHWEFRQLRSGAGTALELASVGGGGNKDFIINTTGHVGIGTESPSETLEVHGNIFATGDVTLERGGSPALHLRSRGNGTQHYSMRATNNADPAGGRLFIIRNENQNRNDLVLGPDGNIIVAGDIILSGADCAEDFEIDESCVSEAEGRSWYWTMTGMCGPAQLLTTRGLPAWCPAPAVAGRASSSTGKLIGVGDGRSRLWVRSSARSMRQTSRCPSAIC